MTTPITTLPQLLPRSPDSHKGTYGRVLVVAGSRGMSGAAVLAGSGALRGGAGLVEVASPAEVQPQIAVGNPCYLTLPLPQDSQGRLAGEAAELILDRSRMCQAVAVGPGLGLGLGVQEVVRRVIAEATAPLVLDADGLNAMAGWSRLPARPSGAAWIVTPHPGEFARLLQVTPAQVQASREELAQRYAQEHGCVVVLKGHRTVVSDGQRCYCNDTGNPGMATGGSGDVLTGLIAALLAQGYAAFEAAQLGVYLHGLAGDIARDHKSEYALIASDVLDHLPAAFVHYARVCQKPFGFRSVRE
jgi:NAD(P)H-hydrate epimerase